MTKKLNELDYETKPNSSDETDDNERAIEIIRQWAIESKDAIGESDNAMKKYLEYLEEYRKTHK